MIKTYEKLGHNLLKEITRLEQTIDKILESNADIKERVDNMQTIPGIGKKTAIALISSMLDISAFEDARQFAAFSGLTPKEYQSGSLVRKRSRISKVVSFRIRKVLYFPAMSAMQHNPLMKEFAKKLRAKSKSGKVMVVAIMRKLSHIIFGLIKHQTVFNPNLAKYFIDTKKVLAERA